MAQVQGEDAKEKVSLLRLDSIFYKILLFSNLFSCLFRLFKALFEEGMARKPSLYFGGSLIVSLARNARQPRSRAVWRELVDVAIQFDLYVIAFGRCVDSMGGQIERQIYGIHSGIIEGRY